MTLHQYQLGKIYPSVVVRPDEVSILHKQRLDGAWCSNKRILAQIDYWKTYYEIQPVKAN